MEHSTEFLKIMVNLLVDKPEEVEIKREVDDRGVCLTLKVAQSDMGKIIGKQGQTAFAMRLLLRVIGSRNKEGVHFRLHDPERDGNWIP